MIKSLKKLNPIQGAALLALFAAAAVAAWLWHGPLAEAPPASTSDSVRFGLAREESASLVRIAQEQGFLAAEGVNLALKEYPSGKLALDGMLAGEVDLATSAEVPIVFSSFQRDDFRIVAGIGDASADVEIIARRSAGIGKPEDLRGKRIATQKASAVHFFLHIFLVKHGLSDEDVRLSFKRPDDLVDALAKGEVDAISMREPYASQAKKRLKDDAISFTEPGLYVKRMVMVAANSMATSRPEPIRKILRALLRAEDFARNNAQPTSQLVGRWLGIETSDVVADRQQLRLGVSLDQALLASMEDEARWASRSHLVEGAKVPNYLLLVYFDGLSAVRGERINVIR